MDEYAAFIARRLNHAVAASSAALARAPREVPFRSVITSALNRRAGARWEKSPIRKAGSLTCVKAARPLLWLDTGATAALGLIHIQVFEY